MRGEGKNFNFTHSSLKAERKRTINNDNTIYPLIKYKYRTEVKILVSTYLR